MSEISAHNQLSYGFMDTPFGECCIAFSNQDVCSLIFPESREKALNDLTKRFPRTKFIPDQETAQTLVDRIFEKGEIPGIKPLGTEFQRMTWNALQQIPRGETVTYTEIAARIGRPKAVRAVGSAIGANPIAYLIPCHRVIRNDGTLGGFRWGLECKKKMLAWEKIK